jgi:hypothetical protein
MTLPIRTHYEAVSIIYDRTFQLRDGLCVDAREAMLETLEPWPPEARHRRG